MSAAADGAGRLPVSAGIPVSTDRDRIFIYQAYYHEVAEFVYSIYNRIMSIILGPCTF